MQPACPLRVALLWHGTVMQEQMFHLPTDPQEVSVGTAPHNTFVLAERPRTVDVGSEITLQRVEAGWVLNWPNDANGNWFRYGESHRLSDSRHGHTLLESGDWAVVHLDPVTLLVQTLDPAAQPPNRRHLRLERTFGLALLASLLLQLLLVLFAKQSWTPELRPESTHFSNQVVRIVDVATTDESVDWLGWR